MLQNGKLNSFHAGRVVFFCATILFFLISFAWAGDTGALITLRCQGCHGMDKTCDVTVDDAGWWNETVLRMVEYKSDLLSADETSEVGLFLADGMQRASLCSSN